MVSAALRYFAIVFSVGFILGAVRTLAVTPRIGATAAVLIELPLILGASWFVATRIVRQERPAPAAALAMGTLAFLLLMIAEATIAVTLSNQSLTQWSAALFETPGWIGLAGQLAFGLFPLLASLRFRPADIRA
jgi:hypothetical protein